MEVDLPELQLTKKAVFEDYKTADAALSDIYSKIRDNGLLNGTGLGITHQLGCYADELIWYGGALSPSDYYYSNALLPSNSSVSEFWRASYNQIYAANAIIEGCEASSSLSITDKKKLIGEALFIRALVHFYLAGLFGDIPYINSTDYRINKSTSRKVVSEVYKQIQKDLLDADEMLNSMNQNANRTRPGKYAVYALLSRVHLFAGQWNEASKYASKIIAQDSFYSLEGIEGVFLKDSKETIWHLIPAAPGKNTDEGMSFIFTAGPPQTYSLQEGLINSFSNTDLRKANWIGTVSNGTARWYYPFKYKKNTLTAGSIEYSVVFRLAEQYLIRAEALAHLDDFSGAQKDLNKIRSRAGLSNTIAVTKEQLLEEILQERSWELFTEYGHRFFDLKRSGKINAVLAAVKPGWNSEDADFPIPQTELDLNPNLLPQNRGY
ncbi:MULTISPECIES: RagB/SusD family nutrient uptake outer membrane protein [Flavobacterium]|uniref:RagB/SusD family nutrient uptake outer membrane protein n=1 Tax=Flavobacterium TaxID=237 RepID=UPI0021159FDA|nr:MULTISPECIES: RagB/SusD family nutrient uptake outer membrane protein [Flavobacterium]UUF12595.1 RagB/SusD family nutrient uptake outer membrane protein [Flavobacterium panici]